MNTGRSAWYDLDIKLNPEAHVLTVWPQLVGLLGTDRIMRALSASMGEAIDGFIGK